MMTDPTADLLTRIRNALGASHETVLVPASKLAKQIARILKEQGYIVGYELRPPEPGRRKDAPDAAGERLDIQLRYTEERQPVISGLRRVSRPGRRTYADSKHIPKVLGGMGTTIVSTSRGVMTGHEARQRGVGGEVVAEVW
ncbi:MAG: 30S ribosomal protein S8 [Actinomycetota bacterium]|nr:30S ribosomal protein S8 [Actinomycetota bacterium]